MTTEIFNGMLSNTTHAISQGLLIPVMIILAIFFVYALINLGIIIAEYYKRRKTEFDFKYFINHILSFKDQKNPDKLIKVIETVEIPQSHKSILITLVNSSNLSREYRESLALKMVEDEGIKAAKRLEKTDIIAKISPAVGLMGTLIPLGPGLTALGAGNIQDLADHLIIAFDAAILGMAAAAIAFSISKIRRRWYEEDISNLETMVDTLLEIL
ncbi:MAG: MotA/TolQ/ExbB proton channel family protein [Methanobacterium sp.]|uniref:MotA/TolQ/ExbB proton channel family protein n=1 Tax=Methanobacterium sp. TaxID=2164 RepID=UPI003D64B0E3|nr:MotA/TolQ/ExbB proton channel family protein [Methanobacterium sp.]